LFCSYRKAILIFVLFQTTAYFNTVHSVPKVVSTSPGVPMKTSLDTRHTAATRSSDLPRLTELTKRRAQALRREAVAEFWHSADLAFHAVLLSASIAARRLAKGI
jgi:hypothetical protein